MYQYKIGETIIKTSKKLYKQDGVWGHKQGDFFVPCSPNLHFKIMMALLPKEKAVEGVK